MTISRYPWSLSLGLLLMAHYVHAFFKVFEIWALAGVLVAVLLLSKRAGGIQLRDVRILGLFGLLLIWCYASVLWSIEPSTTIQSLKSLSFKILIVICALKAAQREWMVLYAAPLAFIVITGLTTCYLLAIIGTLRFSAVQAEDAGLEATFANHIATPVVAMLPFIIMSNGWGRSLRVGLFLVSAALVIVSQSRASLALFAIASILSFLMMGRMRLGRLGWITAVSVAGLVLAFHGLATYAPEAFDRLMSALVTLGDIDRSLVSASAREVADYKRKLQILFTFETAVSPSLLGLGYGAFGVAIETAYGVYVSAHSVLATCLVELGIIGFAIYLMATLGLLTRLWKASLRSWNTRLARAIFVAFIVTNLSFLFRPQLAEPSYYVILALAAVFTAKRPPIWSKPRQFWPGAEPFWHMEQPQHARPWGAPGPNA